MDKGLYSSLKEYLNANLDCYPDDCELEDIENLAIKDEAHKNNRGYRFERTEHNPIERAFYEQWMRENEPHAGINNGNGILQDLFIENVDSMRPLGSRKWVEKINSRDRMIVATVIQWLGSNVGMAFLREALRKCNLQIVEIKTKTNG